MSNNSKSLENLQKALAMELAAVNQYLLHAHTLEDWGLPGLASQMRAEMTEELGHVDAYMRRILFLKGTPRVVPAREPRQATSLKEMFAGDLADEEEAIAFYSEAARIADEEGDVGTKQLFEATVIEEEGHKDHLETQLQLVERLGEAAYFAMQLSSGGTGGDKATGEG